MWRARMKWRVLFPLGITFLAGHMFLMFYQLQTINESERSLKKNSSGLIGTNHEKNILMKKQFHVWQNHTTTPEPTVIPTTATRQIEHDMERDAQHLQDLRRHQIESACSDDVIGSVDRIIQYDNISYCITHKVASTYWVRIFRYLYNDTATGHVKSPFEISKYDTHLLKYKYIKEIPLNSATESAIMNTFRFMFAREPYSRLWSVFIDKFILPDNFFWRTYGSEIKRLRKDGTAKKLCDPISFPEFLGYIANYGTENAAKLDDHYRPLHYGCNPCQLKPHFIGKLETMGADSRYILGKLGISWVSDVHNHESRIREEIAMLIQFNYKMQRYLSSCVSYSDLAERLWKAFKINGYIPATAELTLTGETLRRGDVFFEYVWRVFKAANTTSNEMAMQRTSMKLQAYKDVPIDVLKGIQRMFKLDFELFGYDPEPADIFRRADLRY
ncbi:carbohydrate sulfotransferase 9-like [Haliotis cracherodii]|uniref:carbohydrate sulfotransferase 9-like n=1 Tax=Haliotis cracherodii TaxID=6455 RepID=UPI0039E86404